jgi:hypothetical protein
MGRGSPIWRSLWLWSPTSLLVGPAWPPVPLVVMATLAWEPQPRFPAQGHGPLAPMGGPSSRDLKRGLPLPLAVLRTTRGPSGPILACTTDGFVGAKRLFAGPKQALACAWPSDPFS